MHLQNGGFSSQSCWFWRGETDEEKTNKKPRNGSDVGTGPGRFPVPQFGSCKTELPYHTLGKPQKTHQKPRSFNLGMPLREAGFPGDLPKSSHVADSDVFFWRIKIQQRSLQARQVCWFAGFSSFFLLEMPGVVRFPGNNILGKLSGSFYTNWGWNSHLKTSSCVRG